MCGIAGLLIPSSGNADGISAFLQNMTRSLAHRGPDAEGFWTEGEVALGHRRLSILDLSNAGAQPMRSVSGRYVIVFNGEIYNHRDLRAKLEHAHRFGSRSDVETLLHGYEEYGSSVFERAVGMWAAMVVDLRGPEPVVVLSRDRLGLKPLYYARIPTGWVIGSEPKALLAHPEVTREVSGTGLLQYFMQGWVTYRTRKDRSLDLDSDPHTYEQAGTYAVMVKVIDIFGNECSFVSRVGFVHANEDNNS